MNNKVLVTGANGFVGQALCAALRERGEIVRSAVRVAHDAEQITVGEINANTGLDEGFTRLCYGEYHLAARVHVMNDISSNPLEEFRKVNLFGTRKKNVHAQAAAAGVPGERLVHVVMGVDQARRHQVITSVDNFICLIPHCARQTVRRADVFNQVIADENGGVLELAQRLSLGCDGLGVVNEEGGHG